MDKNLAVSRVINLIPKESQRLWTTDESEARRRLLASDTAGLLALDGSFALVEQDGERVLLARSLDRPMRYFLAKAADGPVLMVAERIDEIATALAERGWAGQFHPSYTRMVPAHHLVEADLVATDGRAAGRYVRPMRRLELLQLRARGGPPSGLLPPHPNVSRRQGTRY